MRWFASVFARGAWEPETLAVLNAFLDTDTVLLDIGAWIGPVTVLGARKASRVVAYEPDPQAFKVLEANVQLNACTNVSCIAAAVTDQEGVVRLSGGTRGGRFGCSTSTVLLPADELPEAVEVQSHTFDQAVDRLALANGERLFVKMDIEGGEGLAIPASDLMWRTRHATVLLVSLHTRFIGEALANAVVSHLLGHFGYDAARSVSWDAEARRARLTPVTYPLAPDFMGSILFGSRKASFPVGWL